jgi:hypothetical protein
MHSWPAALEVVFIIGTIVMMYAMPKAGGSATGRFGATDGIAIFARRGEPWNVAEWHDTHYVRSGCTSVTFKDSKSARTWTKNWCYDGTSTRSENPTSEFPKVSKSLGRRSIFDFLYARRVLEERILNSVKILKSYHEDSDMRYHVLSHVSDELGEVENVKSRGNTIQQSFAALEHGAEQIEYLVEIDRIPSDFLAIAKEYRISVETVRSSSEFEDLNLNHEGCCYEATLKALQRQNFLHNTLLYWPPPMKQPPTSSVLNPSIDWSAVQSKYARGEVVVVDDVLSQWALDAAYNFCLEATIFFEPKIGYLGAYKADGMTSGPFLDITDAFRRSMPEVVGDLELAAMWAYKYNPSKEGGGVPQSGVNKHTDLAKVNLNIWVTPDEANLDPETGGMVVWDYSVLSMEGYVKFQQHSAEVRTSQLLQNAGAKFIRIPYKRNRMVLFDSSLVHETDAMRFKRGYKNRRINLTWLFGSAPFAAT